MATGRSSGSDHRVSTYSGERSDEKDTGSDHTIPTEVVDHEGDVRSAVDDVIDAYYYDDDIYGQVPGSRDSQQEPMSSSPIEMDQEESQILQSQTRQQDSPRFSNPFSADQAGNEPLSHFDNTVTMADPTSLYTHPDSNNPYAPDGHYQPSQYASSLPDQQQRQTEYLPPLDQLSPLQLQYSSVKLQSPLHSATEARSSAWQRSSEDIPRQTQTVELKQGSKSFDRQWPYDIHKELKQLPQLPPKKSRLSRQDWASIQAYAKKNGKDFSETGNDQSSGQSGDYRPKRPVLAVQQPAQKKSDTLPEADEDDAYPRRASTSVFDRRSAFLDLGNLRPSPPVKSMTTDFGDARAAEKQRLAQTLKVSTSPVQRDRYGFKKASNNITVQEYDTWFSKYDEYVTRRRNKWVTLLEKSGLPTYNPTEFPERGEKVRRYTRKGYPPEWRGAMWWFYSGGQFKMDQGDMAGLYSKLLERVKDGELNKDDREAIERDLDRTFPDNIHFRIDPTSEHPDVDEEPRIIKDLREVLSCFALNNPSIGYCQSLNFIAGLLLLFLKNDTERAFIMLTIITEYHLPGAHARSLANTEVNVLMMLIKDYLPKVWNSINDTDLVNNGPGSHAHPDSKFQRQPTVALSCTSWFMSLFVGVLPIETVLRVWDAFLYEGPRALFRYALAIFKLGENEIKKFRPGDGEVFMAVQNLPRKCIDPNILHDIAYVKKGFGSLSQNVIDSKRHFWEEQNNKNKGKDNSSLDEKEELVQVTETEKEAKMLGGLRRKASRRFLRRKEL
jgi:hypothetical protein